MTPIQPYLLRAVYDWIVDNDMTPHLLVNAEDEDAQVPRQYVQDGKIVLNIAPSAVQTIDLGNEWIQFHARFSGTPYLITIPIHAVLAIHARETGQGMAFEANMTRTRTLQDDFIADDEGNDQPPPPPRPPRKGKPVLRRVK